MTATMIPATARRPSSHISSGVPSRYVVVAPTRSTYVRRRVGVLTFLVALVASSAFAAHDGLADRGGAPASAATVGRAPTYVVQPGDTLWSIAGRLAPSGSRSAYVDALVAANGGSSLVPGQQLTLP